MDWQRQATFVLLLAFTLAGVAVVALTLLRRARRRHFEVSDEPRCGECGYIVHPGASRTCPECGADLAAVGVFTPATAPPPFPLLSVYAASFLLLLAAILFGPRLARLTPLGWEFRAWHVIDTS